MSNISVYEYIHVCKKVAIRIFLSNTCKKKFSKYKMFIVPNTFSVAKAFQTSKKQM